MKAGMRLRTLFTALALGVTVLAGAQTTPTADKATLTPEVRETVMKEVNRIVTSVAFVPGVDFSKWTEFMETQKESVDKAQTPRDLTAAVNAALRKFGISHIVMSTPEAATARRNRSTVGIGVQIQPEPGKGIRVLNVFPDSPAFGAGVLPGDLIVEADGKKVESPADMAGEEGATVTIRVDREGKPKTFKITRRKYSNVRPETLTWPTPDTAVLKINTFDLAYNAENVETLVQEAAKAKNLLIDLRSNGGGAVTNLIHLLSLLLPERTPIGTFVQKGMVDRFVKETGGSPTDLDAIARFADRPVRTSKPKVDRFKGNVGVLVNGGSGSASEIAAAALHENLGSPIIGSKSAGAVLVSIMGPLPHGFMLQYPVTDYVTTRGIRLEGNGVEPMVEGPAVVRWGEKDQALDKAVLLMNRISRREDTSGKSGT